MKTILVTGGIGYIGSHTVVELLDKGYDVIIVDDLSNSKLEVLDRIEAICGKRPIFYQVNIGNEKALEDIFKGHVIDGVIHFAASKVVGESIELPLEYYRNNVVGTLVLCEMMQKYDVKNLIYSSSATVYGNSNISPLKEDMPVYSTSPYGSTKIVTEQLLQDLCVENDNWSIVALRYFNPIGAHPSGLIGENPRVIPSNLMPHITKVANGEREKLLIFGCDYDTPDGTCVRDFIHVVDVAKGHMHALEYLEQHSGLEIVNLGTGTGCTVLNLVNCFMKATGIKVSYDLVERRPSDIAISYANVSKAKRLLNWEAEKSYEAMCQDAW